MSGKKKIDVIIVTLIIIITFSSCLQNENNYEEISDIDDTYTSSSNEHSDDNIITKIIEDTKYTKDTEVTEDTKVNSETSISEVQEIIEEDFTKLIDQINDYIKKYVGVYGIYYKNLITGDSFGINEFELFYPASTIKLPLNLYVFKKISMGEIDPEQKLEYKKEDFEWGTGTIISKVKQGLEYPDLEYTIRKLCEFSIIYSDNIAANMLYRVVGKENLIKYLEELGGFSTSDKINVSPYDMGIYIEELYRFYIDHPVLGGELIGYLSNTVYNNRIPAYLPENKELDIAHKIGNLPKLSTLHDVGIIFTEQPYILCIMSKDIDYGDDGSDGCKIIAQISKIIYDFVK